ncbi:MAG: lysine--tRNA ligase [Candidatus Aenigmarchaeota archaeon]|nr:lysine--tRNA ligase [Candidatus Aenigmarchaeota archaeon]
MDQQSLFWADATAREVVEAWKADRYRTEMGMGASGVPHIGSVGDGVRSYAVALGIRSLGKESELIAYSDDRDGLRKVPQGFPSSLEKELGKPVSSIPDPFGCHRSFALHVSSLLVEAFERLGVQFTLHRGSEEYQQGTLDREIETILKHAKRAGEIVKETTGSEKFLEALPFLAVCAACGRIYTTRALSYEKGKVRYVCDQEFIGKAGNRQVALQGCGFQGEASIREGKLAWKVEFAARWKALDIHFEAYGKDILDSVRCNDAICRELLGREPPVHAFYELFTERGGQKLSKSKGNVFTPQTWMTLGSPESLRLLFLKRLGTSRVVDEDAIPALMDEVDELGKVYRGEIREPNKRELAHKKRLFEYVHSLQPAPPGFPVAYTAAVNLARCFPPRARERAMKEILLGTQVPGPQALQDLERRIQYASRFAGEEPPARGKVELDAHERKALLDLADALKTLKEADQIQDRIFEIAKARGLRPGDFFKILYKVLIGLERGPRAGRLIELLGPQDARTLLKDRA